MTPRGRLGMYAVRGRPLWRPLRMLAILTVMAWAFVLLGSLGWAAWITGWVIGAAAYMLGAME